jgi:hypothetical protein
MEKYKAKYTEARNYDLLDFDHIQSLEDILTDVEDIMNDVTRDALESGVTNPRMHRQNVINFLIDNLKKMR